MIGFDAILGNVRGKAPLVHNITNYVTANDCANILLACGASPIMADEPDEVEEITARCDGLTVNMGTLNRRKIPAMLRAGARANELGRPVLLDPVGAGASSLRAETAAALLDRLQFAVVRGNVSEIRALTQGTRAARGVDAGAAEHSAGSDGVTALAKALARKSGAVVAVTGPTDIISDGARVCAVANGHAMLGKITGAGCMLSAMTTAFVAANPAEPFEAVCAAVIAMGLCGELAHARLGPLDGSGSYRAYLIDAVYNLTAQQLKDGANYEMR